jgi:hypothetical protein
MALPMVMSSQTILNGTWIDMGLSCNAREVGKDRRRRPVSCADRARPRTVTRKIRARSRSRLGVSTLPTGPGLWAH